MSSVAWIAAGAEGPVVELLGLNREAVTSSPRAQRNREEIVPQENAAGRGEEAAGSLQNSAEELENAAWAAYEQQRQRGIYRARTVGMLRRYMRYSIETGRLPSLVGREFFRSKITKYQMATFEDRVIFVHDMERCLEQLDDFGRQVLGRIVLQEYGQEDAARLLGCTRMTVHRKLLESLDELSEILISVNLLDELRRGCGKPCQGGQEGTFLLSTCKDGK
jgi:DNA-directed RNA polymerase specialized sigma24 family protein